MGASTRRQLTVFAIICLVVSWGLWLVAGIHGTPVTSSPAIWWFALGASGPSLAALGAYVVLRHGNVPRTRVRVPWLWLPLALVLGALPAVVTEAALDAGGFGSSAGGVVAASGGLLLFVVTFLIAGPLAEEFGWRGYLQPRLRTRFGILATAAVVGAAWAVWHVPLFFLEGTGQQAMGLFTLRGLLFMVSLLPLSVTYLFLTERLGGAVWAAILVHFAGNAAGALLPQASDVAAVLQFAVILVIAAIVYAAWRRAPTTAAQEAVATAISVDR
ncbi:hypothetical protein ASG80_08035 [Agromyces sp. Soil535]|nr:hypothetical protein ASG80_08035 [Agromyces sp. Soil535]